MGDNFEFVLSRSLTPVISLLDTFKDAICAFIKYKNCLPLDETKSNQHNQSIKVVKRIHQTKFTMNTIILLCIVYIIIFIMYS